MYLCINVCVCRYVCMLYMYAVHDCYFFYIFWLLNCFNVVVFFLHSNGCSYVQGCCYSELLM